MNYNANILKYFSTTIKYQSILYWKYLYLYVVL
nr:MAG TPA: hypothetical protein [Caudoviricetes sp.]